MVRVVTQMDHKSEFQNGHQLALGRKHCLPLCVCSENKITFFSSYSASYTFPGLNSNVFQLCNTTSKHDYPTHLLLLTVSSSADGKSAMSQDLHMACSSSLASNRKNKMTDVQETIRGNMKIQPQMHRDTLQFDRGQKPGCDAVPHSCDSYLIQ